MWEFNLFSACVELSQMYLLLGFSGGSVTLNWEQ